MMDDRILMEMALEFGTPSFVFDADDLASRAQKIKKILNQDLISTEIHLCYSIKANPFLIPPLIESGAVESFEVCSPGELAICERYKVPGAMIIYSGVHKELWDITEAIEYGASVLTAESVRQYELILKATENLDREAEVILRLSSKSQFGMSPEDIEHILMKNGEGSRVKITGLHYFAGTQRTKLRHQREELSELKEIITGLRDKYGVLLNKLEYGPGLPHPYFVKDDFTDTLSPLKELSADLKGVSDWSELTVEMGRFIASGAGYYLTRAVDIKRSFDRNWCILDGGINHVNYLGQMMGMMVPVIRCIRGEELYRVRTACDEKEESGAYNKGGSPKAKAENDDMNRESMDEWALCGSLCTTNDVLVRSFRMEEPKLSDLFVFCNIGAYSVTEAMNLFLSRNMPKVVMIRDGSASLLRDTLETWRLNC